MLLFIILVTLWRSDRNAVHIFLNNNRITFTVRGIRPLVFLFDTKTKECKIYRPCGCVRCTAGKVNELSTLLLSTKLYFPDEMNFQETNVLSRQCVIQEVALYLKSRTLWTKIFVPTMSAVGKIA